MLFAKIHISYCRGMNHYIRRYLVYEVADLVPIGNVDRKRNDSFPVYGVFVVCKNNLPVV
jgi:hypothetical protein